MISRLRHGWSRRTNADAYGTLLRNRRTARHSPGARIQGAQVLRREVKDEVEFVTITLFDLLDAVKQFAGEDYEIAVILPEAHRLLVRFDARSAHSAHYETVFHLD